MASDVAHGVEEALSGNKVVWIVMMVIIGVFVALYFRRYHLIKQQGKANRRRRRNQNQEMTSINDTRDII